MAGGDDVARLGFEIDTATLANAGTTAEATAKKLATVGDAAEQMQKQVASATAGTAQLESNLRRVRESLDPMARATNAYSDQQRVLDQALAQGKLSQTEHAALLATAKQRMEQQTGAVRDASQVHAQFANTVHSLTGKVEALASSFGTGGGSGAGMALNGGLRAANEAILAVGGSMTGVGGAMAMGGAAAVTLTGIYIGLSAELAKIVDEEEMAAARLKYSLGSWDAARRTISEMKEAAHTAGISIDQTVNSFVQLSRVSNELGATREDMSKFIETVQKLGVVSGASSQDVSSGLAQLQQTLAFGRFTFRELRSLMATMPALTKSIADGLGISVAQMKSLGEAGELTGDRVFRAILTQQDKVNQQFTEMPQTTERAFQRVKNSFEEMLQALGQRLESSPFMRTLLHSADVAMRAAEKLVAPPNEEGMQQRYSGMVAAYGGDESKLPAWIREDMQRRRAQAQKDVGDQVDASRREEQIGAVGIVNRAAGVATETNDFERKQKQLRRQVQQLEDANIALSSGALTGSKEIDDAADSIHQNNVALRILREKMKEETDAFSKYREGNIDLAQQLAIGGGGGGVDIVKGAQEIQKAAIKQGQNASLGQAIGLLTQHQVLTAGAEITTTDRQTAAQQRMTATLGQQLSVVREVEIANDALDFRWKNFGAVTGPAVEEVIKRYTAALRASKAATDEYARGQAFQTIRDNLGVIAAQSGAVSAGAYAMREAEARAKAAIEERTMPGVTAQRMAEFAAREGLSSIQQREGANRATALSMGLTAAAGRPADIRAIQDADAIRKAIEGVAPGERDGVAAAERSRIDAGRVQGFAESGASAARQLALTQRLTGASGNYAQIRAINEGEQIRTAREAAPAGMESIAESRVRSQLDAERTKTLSDQAADLREQLEYSKQQVVISGSFGEKLMVETALLQKKRELMKQGVDLASAEAQQQLSLTEQLAQQQYVLSLAQERANAMKQIWSTASFGIQNTFADMFNLMFTHAENRGKQALSLIGNTAASVASKILAAVVYAPIEQFARLYGQQMSASFFPGFGGGGNAAVSGTGPGGSTSFGGLGFEAPASVSARGNVFMQGNVVPFARGGVVTRPTLFPMANGAGLMGEAGPEGILPLRRNARGQLGVMGGGDGGTSVVVNDMRSTPGSAPVEVLEGRGPDGRRQLSIMVRDEVRSSISSGAYDTQMRSTYGATRRMKRL